MKLIAVNGGDAGHGDDGRGGPLDRALEVAADGMLAIARRETLALAAALQSHDADAVLLASRRLRWSLACAEHFAARSPTALMRARLVAVCEAADRWLPQGSRDDARAPRLQHLLGQLREPGLGLRTICADDSLIVALDLDGLELIGISVRGATVAHVTARRARLEAMQATKARMARSDFKTAGMRRSILDQAVLDECSLSKANLESTSWREATLTRCVATGAVFINAELEGTQFVDCDLRDTDFQGEVTMHGARFLRCDLRESKWTGRNLSGVSFVGCRMYGIHGRVGGLDATVVEQADLSHGGNGERSATKNELLDSWQEDEWTI